MTQKQIKRIHIIYATILSLLILTLGALLIFSCLRIYQSGPRPFSRDSVAAALSDIVVPICITVIWALGAIPLSLLLPLEKAKQKGKIRTEETLHRLSAKLDPTRCSPDLMHEIKREQTFRRIGLAVLTLFYLAGAVLALLYATSTASFPAKDANAEILAATLRLVLYLAPPFALSLLAILLNHLSRSRELALTKEALRAQNGQLAAAPQKVGRLSAIKAWYDKNERTVTLAVRIVLAVAGLACLVAGILNGGAEDVLQKAIKICTECIGLG